MNEEKSTYVASTKSTASWDTFPWKWRNRYFSLGWEPERLKDFYSPAELKFPRERNWQSETTSKIEYAYNYVRTWNQGQGKK